MRRTGPRKTGVSSSLRSQACGAEQAYLVTPDFQLLIVKSEAVNGEQSCWAKP